MTWWTRLSWQELIAPSQKLLTFSVLEFHIVSRTTFNRYLKSNCLLEECFKTPIISSVKLPEAFLWHEVENPWQREWNSVSEARYSIICRKIIFGKNTCRATWQHVTVTLHSENSLFTSRIHFHIIVRWNKRNQRK